MKSTRCSILWAIRMSRGWARGIAPRSRSVRSVAIGAKEAFLKSIKKVDGAIWSEQVQTWASYFTNHRALLLWSGRRKFCRLWCSTG